MLAKGYLPISLVTPLKLQEILDLVEEALIKTNPECDIVIKRLHLYYNMKLVIFGRETLLYNFNFCATLHTATVNIISIRKFSSSYC